MTMHKIAGFTLAVLTPLLLAACSTTNGETAKPVASAAPFDIADVSISPMTQANLCRDLGGQGQAPTVTINHTATAGVPIRIKLTDHWSDGGTFDHRSTRAVSDGSGTTTVTYGFLPPCNTTGGRINSDYRFTIQAGDQTETVRWARFNSASRTIN